MASMLKNNGTRAEVVSVAKFLYEHKAIDVSVIEIREQSSFADFFVIASVQSFGQLRGLLKNLDDELASHGIYTKSTKRAIQEDDTWLLLDCGDFVVHLMTEEARSFYALEKLWFQSPKMDPNEYQSSPH